MHPPVRAKGRGPPGAEGGRRSVNDLVDDLLAAFAPQANALLT